MSTRRYPYYVSKLPGNPRWPATVLCELCAAPATCYALVQWSWFRSDDEQYRVCDRHLSDARANTVAFCDAVTAIRMAVGKK